MYFKLRSNFKTYGFLNDTHSTVYCTPEDILTYSRSDLHTKRKATYIYIHGGDIHLERVIHAERHTHKAIYTRNDKQTKRHPHENDLHKSRPTYKATYIGNDIHMRGYAHGGDGYILKRGSSGCVRAMVRS